MSTENLLESDENADRRPSLAVPYLRRDENQFFELVTAGDITALSEFLSAHKTLNANCVNYEGLSALHLAIKAEDAAMVKYLFLRPDLLLRDSALHAVATGNIEITELILDELNIRNRNSEMNGYAESPVYSPDITPLLLAAHCGDYKMVRMLLSRNHKVEKPHIPSCLCATCKLMISDSGSSQSWCRLNSYRAIASPAYFCQITDDPFFYSFVLDKELKKCAELDKEFRAEYTELAQEIRQFTVDMVSHCRNPAEVNLLLVQEKGYKGSHKNVAYPRLQLAIDFYQKEFVAQSMIQQVLNTHWLGDYTIWPRLKTSDKVGRVFLRVFSLPVMAVLCMVAPSSSIVRKWKSPINKFLSSLASYSVFVFVVFLLIHIDKWRTQRGPPRTGLESIVLIFVLGFVWATFKQYWIQGWRRFFKDHWHWYDMCMEGIFMLTFLLWLKSWLDVQHDRKHKRRMLERKYWHSLDATLLHEGFFAIGSILCSGRLLYYCQQSSRLGPLQVSLGKMAVQIAYFLLFCFLIIFCFASAMTRLYKYYDGMVQTAADGQTKVQLASFSTFGNSMVTLFWAMFGMSPVEAADIVISNLNENKTNPVINHHSFTEDVGRTLFGLYHLLMGIALINTLVAILTNSFQKVVDNVDVEWKFARTKLWAFFFHEATVLPSPFNMLPSPNLIATAYTWCLACTKKIDGAQARFSLKRCCYVEYDKPDKEDLGAYHELMANLVQRYFHRRT